MITSIPKVFLFFPTFLLVVLLSACGQKGPLYIQNDEMPKVEYVYEEEPLNTSTENKIKEPKAKP